MSTLPRPIFPDNWPPQPMRKWPPSWRCWTFGARCAGWCPAGLSPKPTNFPPRSHPPTPNPTHPPRPPRPPHPGPAQPNALLPGITQLLDPGHNLVAVLGAGQLPGSGGATQAANALMAQARRLAARESFFHWWTSFPTVFGGGDKARATPGGFDAIIGNPPWDRIKLQEVEWFAERDLHIAAQARAADRKRLIGALQSKKSPLWQSYLQASERAQATARAPGKAAATTRCSAVATSPSTACSSNAPRPSSTRKAWWPCSPPAASPPTKGPQSSSATSAAPADCTLCSTLKTAGSSFPMWIADSNSARWCSAKPRA